MIETARGALGTIRGMPSLRTLATVVGLIAIAAPVPGTAIANDHAPTAAAAKKKKKKKKKPKGITATVNATLTVRETDPLGFGNDNGPSWQELKVTIKNAEIPVRDPGRDSGGAKVPVTVSYNAEASTQDRSWHAGCDSENIKSSGTWTGKLSVAIKTSKWLDTKGVSKGFQGWTVWTESPEDFPWTTTRTWVDWESILMEQCLNFDSKTPLGGWGPGFSRVEGVGKMTSDNRSVLITGINTDVNETGTASGSIKFSASPTPSKTAVPKLN